MGQHRGNQARCGMTYSVLWRDIATRHFLTFGPEVAEEEDDDMRDIMKKFLEIDSIGLSHKYPRTPNEQKAHRQVSTPLPIKEHGYYKVAVPWKKDPPELTNNRLMAEKRLVSLEKRLIRDPGVSRQYREVLEEYVDKQYVRKVPESEDVPQGEWFLPHFPVVRLEKETTKVRVVFDASARFEGVSLNDVALPGPKLQTDIVDIFVIFRKGLIAVVGDISQMYHQLSMRPSDRSYHRYLWRDMDLQKKPEVHEFLRFIFGGNYCPFCAQYTWQTHSQQNKDKFPDAAEAVEREEETKELRSQLKKLGRLTSVHIRKWLSNSTDLLEDIPEDDRAKQIDLERGKLSTSKTLGIWWNSMNDTFTFRIERRKDLIECTKRNVLKQIATIFDPLGLLSQFIVRAKILMQLTWNEKLDWDEPLPENIERAWCQWIQGLDQLQVQRCLHEDNEVQDISIL